MTKLVDFDILYSGPDRSRRVIFGIAVGLSGLMCLSGLAVLGAGYWYNQKTVPPPLPTQAYAPPRQTGGLVQGGQPPDGWGQVFQETFFDQRNAWGLASSDNDHGTIRASTIDGALHWELAAKEPVLFSDRPRSNTFYTDAYITLEATVVSSQPDADLQYGIMFRRLNSETYYLFEVFADGRFRVQMRAGDHFETLVRTQTWDVRHTQNKLGVLAVGGHLAFFINDVQVAQIDPAGAQLIPAGRIGLFADLEHAGQTATIDFRYMEVYAPKHTP